MLNKIRHARGLYNWLSGLEPTIGKLELQTRSHYKNPKVLTGTLLARMNQELNPNELREVEFQVFSQFGDDGIIQYLVHGLSVAEHTFIEFGVEDYTEANTRFLLVKDKWSGLVMDGSAANVDYIRSDWTTRFFDVRAEQAFITAENINEQISGAGFAGRIGLLSIDIDGMDYWVWRAIIAVDPAIVVIEYNALFGSERAITVPYKANFLRAEAHASRLYWGASLAALRELAGEKGYTFIGCNGNGNNVYFVRNELATAPALAGLKAKYQPASFAEYAPNGRPVRGAEAAAIIRGLPVYNIRTCKVEPL